VKAQLGTTSTSSGRPLPSLLLRRTCKTDEVRISGRDKVPFTNMTGVGVIVLCPSIGVLRDWWNSYVMSEWGRNGKRNGCTRNRA
jgi:hypothetical protein